MLIVADPNIQFVEEAFSSLGRIRLIPGRECTAQSVEDADILLVRSVTQVDRRLLEHSRVRFVGSATSGFDHIDRAYLDEANIGFAYAPGSNAESVAEYVVSALCVLCRRRGWMLADLSAGVVGCGRVGSAVIDKLELLGITCLKNDPPLAQATGSAGYHALAEIIDADIITLHVPLVHHGPHRTLGLIGETLLAQMKPGAVLINAARGGVVDEQALLRRLQSGGGLHAVIDCWADEPDIDARLLRHCALGTPHIAGYSFEGKVEATAMLYAAACRFLRCPPRWSPVSAGPAAGELERDIALKTARLQPALCAAVARSYDIERDSSWLIQALAGGAGVGKAFDEIRKNYPVRREFSHYRVGLPPSAGYGQTLAALGFQLGST